MTMMRMILRPIVVGDDGEGDDHESDDHCENNDDDDMVYDVLCCFLAVSLYHLPNRKFMAHAAVHANAARDVAWLRRWRGFQATPRPR